MALSTLSPTIAEVDFARLSLCNTVETSKHLPPFSQLVFFESTVNMVNRWSNQIPALLDSQNSPGAANAVFAIRNILFNNPPTQIVCGIPINDLPQVYKDFLAFTLKLVDAQAPKVCPFLRGAKFLFLIILS